MRERELTEEDARAAAQAGEIARLQSELEEVAAKQPEAPPKFLQLDDPEFAVRFESLMKTGLYSLENVRAALETTKQEGKYSSTRADAYLKAILVAQRNDVLAARQPRRRRRPATASSQDPLSRASLALSGTKMLSTLWSS